MFHKDESLRMRKRRGEEELGIVECGDVFRRYGWVRMHVLFLFKNDKENQVF